MIELSSALRLCQNTVDNAQSFWVVKPSEHANAFQNDNSHLKCVLVSMKYTCFSNTHMLKSQ